MTAAGTAAVSDGCRDGFRDSCSYGFIDGAAAAAAMLSAIAQQRCATTPHGAATAQRWHSNGTVAATVQGYVGSDRGRDSAGRAGAVTKSVKASMGQ